MELTQNDKQYSSDFQYIVGLHEPIISPELVGNKFYQLSAISRKLNIPNAFCLKATTFEVALKESGAYEKLQEYLQLLKSNGGYQLHKIFNSIQKYLSTLQIPESALNEIRIFSEKISSNWMHPLIVRTSSSFEDKDSISGAGIYHSINNINSSQDMVNAILECWKASFSLTALAHRLRIGEFDINNLAGIIVQRFVLSNCAGVTFSTSPADYSTNGIYAEYSTEGGTSGIESGKAIAKSLLIIPQGNSTGFIVNDTDLDKDQVQQLFDTTITLKDIFKREIEYEWAFDGDKICVFQVRPITTPRSSYHANVNNSVFRMYDLYKDENQLRQEQLGDISGIFEHSIKKRKPIRTIVESLGGKTYGAAILVATRSGIAEEDFDNLLLPRT